MCQQYYKSFKNNTDVFKYAGGALRKELGIVDVELEVAGVDWDDAADEELVAAEVAAKECVLAFGLLASSNCTHYGKLLEDLKNDFMQGWDNYPPMVQQAYSLLVHWKQDPWNIIRLIGGTNDGMAFTNVGTEELGHNSGNRG